MSFCCHDVDRGLVRNHKTSSADVFRLLTLTIEAPKKRNRTVIVTNIKRKSGKKMIVSKIEIKLQFPYVVQAQYEHHTAADTHLQ